MPVLLKDESQIVVIIEDNGWGYGDFFPTTVRTSLQNNWHNNYWVNATDPNREKTLNFNFCPTSFCSQQRPALRPRYRECRVEPISI